MYLFYENHDAAVQARVEDLLRRLTLTEKLDLLGGTDSEGKALSRLGIAGLAMADAPHGVRWGKATALPPGVAMAATWNEDLIETVGAALGRELRAKGRDVLLGPCLNIHRTPLGGRNVESFGEDLVTEGQLFSDNKVLTDQRRQHRSNDVLRKAAFRQNLSERQGTASLQQRGDESIPHLVRVHIFRQRG